jgi:hypothetical protein
MKTQKTPMNKGVRAPGGIHPDDANARPAYVQNTLKRCRRSADTKPRFPSWEWYGHAAHFICGDKCRFHLATKIGRYLVSTVGELWPEQEVRRIYAQVHDQKWLEDNQHLKGDHFDAAYMFRFGFDTVGDRKYETMVFEAGKPCSTKKCGCGLPEISGLELDLAGYNSAKDARAGHMAMCLKWANHYVGGVESYLQDVVRECRGLTRAELTSKCVRLELALLMASGADLQPPPNNSK